MCISLSFPGENYLEHMFCTFATVYKKSKWRVSMPHFHLAPPYTPIKCCFFSIVGTIERIDRHNLLEIVVVVTIRGNKNPYRKKSETTTTHFRCFDYNNNNKAR